MSATGHEDARLLVFARAPLAGRVKTRLIPVLGAEGAACLYRQLLLHSLEAAAGVPGVVRELWCAGDDEGDDDGEGACVELARRYSMALRRQAGGDLGARMAGALESALGSARTTSRLAVLIGSDCPGYNVRYLASAFTALAEEDAVLGPAVDGGYVLIGLRRAAPALFEKMPWGSGEVLALTRERLAALGWRWCELPTLRDIDRPEDLSDYLDWPRLAGGLAPEPR